MKMGSEGGSCGQGAGGARLHGRLMAPKHKLLARRNKTRMECAGSNNPAGDFDCPAIVCRRSSLLRQACIRPPANISGGRNCLALPPQARHMTSRRELLTAEYQQQNAKKAARTTHHRAGFAFRRIWARKYSRARIACRRIGGAAEGPPRDGAWGAKAGDGP